MPRIKGIDDHIPLQPHEIPQPVEINGVERTERLSIALFDLDRIPNQEFRVKLVGGRLKAEPIWVVKDKPDEVAVEFTCGLLHAAMVCDRIRSDDRAMDDVPSRVWINRGSGWVRLTDRAVLTVEEDGRTILNPEIFPRIAAKVVVEPPKLKRIW